MGKSRNHYDVLGVRPGADIAVIKKEYLKKARLLHPDNNLRLTQQELKRRERDMKDLNAAWTIISNPEKRNNYDQTLNRKNQEDTFREANRKISQEFLEEEYIAKPQKPSVASQDEMELRGFAKLMKPLPLFIMMALIVGAVLIGFLIGGNTGDSTPSNGYTPEISGQEPKLCIDLAPVQEVPCDGRQDANVWEIIGVNDKCSSGFSYEYRSQIGGGYCVTYRNQ